jgi:hypothetical protein
VDYRTNELTFALPGTGWKDSSVQRLDLLAPDGATVSFELSRSAARPGDALAARVEADIESHRRHLRGFELVERQSFTWTGGVGFLTSFRALAPEGALQHEVAHLPTPDALFVLRVWAPVAHAEACREVVRATLESLALRLPGA